MWIIFLLALLLFIAIGCFWGYHNLERQTERIQEQIKDWQKFLRLNRRNKELGFKYIGIRLGVDMWLPELSREGLLNFFNQTLH